MTNKIFSIPNRRMIPARLVQRILNANHAFGNTTDPPPNIAAKLWSASMNKNPSTMTKTLTA